ncbi:MAG: NAD(P)-binding protein [Deltaproteobacteria bacterium]|nr:NAD(P)-binding protein [Deltaproteobacteria bacterium]
MPISRRGFLKSTAVAGVASFAAACGNDQDATPESGSVVIVGGGIAGLHCAYRLRQAGLNPYLFDARSRLGGRVLTDRTSFPGGQHADLYATSRFVATGLGVPSASAATKRRPPARSAQGRSKSWWPI